MSNSIFCGKTLLITGGTGSFGNAVLNRFLQTDIGEIRIFSRDEKKQDDMRHEFQAKMPDVADKIQFYIGDVRDLQSVKNAMHGVDYIFHAAALKQVPSCEFFPLEAVKTNVFGTDNVLTAAIEEGVKNVVCLSTDKAAYPVNAMGTSKAMMEKVIVAKSRTVSPEKTKIFSKGDTERNTLTEFNSSNTKLLNVEQVKEKLLSLQYIREELAKTEK